MIKDKFKMWKLALSTIHIDGKVTLEEEKWFEEKIATLTRNKLLGFSEEQISELLKVLHSPPENFEQEFELIEDPYEASFVIHILKMVSHVDGDLAESENELYKKLSKAAMKEVSPAAVEKIKQVRHVKVSHDESLMNSVIGLVSDFCDKIRGK